MCFLYFGVGWPEMHPCRSIWPLLCNVAWTSQTQWVYDGPTPHNSGGPQVALSQNGGPHGSKSVENHWYGRFHTQVQPFKAQARLIVDIFVISTKKCRVWGPGQSTGVCVCGVRRPSVLKVGSSACYNMFITMQYGIVVYIKCFNP